MKWVPCWRCGDYTLIEDEPEPAPGAMRICVPHDAHVIREDWDRHYAKTERRAHTAIERGDKRELLSFINWCFMNRLVVPSWAQEKFSQAMQKSHGIRTWEEVFGRPVKKGARLPDAMRRSDLAPRIWDSVNDRHEAGEPISKELFEVVGEKLGCGGTLVGKIYYEILKEFKDQE